MQVKNGKVRAHLSWRSREHRVCKGWRKLPTVTRWKGGVGSGREGLEWQAEARPSGPQSVSILYPHPPYKWLLENYISLQTSSSDFIWRSLQQGTCKSDHKQILEGDLKKGLSWESHITSLQNGRLGGTQNFGR